MSAEFPLPAEALGRAQALLTCGGRRLLGLAGAPGSGKSTLADALCRALPPGSAVVVPMDGFHLSNAELHRLHRRERKGAPDTFDAAGYVALLRRLRAAPPDEVVWAPAYRREIEEPVAGAIAVPAGTPLVITEGNYLLLDESPWGQVRELLDEAWYLQLDDGLRRERLAQRHQRFGRSAEAAQAWIAQTDEPNARLIAGCRERADWALAL